ncbi:hypothetical protein [Rhizobium sp. GN54]|uniref:hypothetical protein n=1 Tax=Rhizobium sp. GN54 TaxID=2898150 RepID=UPI001E516B4B|nr:hypothetical protein [Rhizobium sp. GN54]MCD2185233.1 hypothetical protein [Rhizobium sp. GN54]
MSTVWTINFDQIVEVLDSGIRRADIFMGIGLNAAANNPPISHVLSQAGPGIKLVKDELSEEEKVHVSHEFAKWIRANGFRELTETFSIFLLRIYDVIYHVHLIYGDGTKIMPVARFERLGIADQIDQLQKFIPIPGERIEILKSLNQARNCYAHRRGVVGANDIEEASGSFDLKWLRLTYELEEPDGTVLPEAEMFGRLLPKGGTVRMRIEIDRQIFSAGEELVVGKDELKHICLCVHIIGQGIAAETTKFALALGAKAIAPTDKPPPKAISHNDP